MDNNTSKQKVIQAASLLFFQKGFHATTVRDIAEKASVNVSLISYYFKGKQGLLEYAVTQYYDAYLHSIKDTLHETKDESDFQKLQQVIYTIVHYKQSHYQLSCFIHRELSLDSMFVREMAVTYLAKENYLISNLLYNALNAYHQEEFDQHFLLMQLKGMLVTPYVLHNEWKHQVVGEFSHQYFIEKYVRSIHDWLEFIINKQKTPKVNV